MVTLTTHGAMVPFGTLASSSPSWDVIPFWRDGLSRDVPGVIAFFEAVVSSGTRNTLGNYSHSEVTLSCSFRDISCFRGESPFWSSDHSRSMVPFWTRIRFLNNWPCQDGRSFPQHLLFRQTFEMNFHLTFVKVSPKQNVYKTYKPDPRHQYRLRYYKARHHS